MIVVWLRVLIVGIWFFASSILILPVLLLRPKHPKNAYIYTRFVMPVGTWLLGVRINIRGQEKIASTAPCVYVANHQSTLDMFLHGTFFPSTTATVGKKSIIWIPIFGWVFLLVGSVLIDRKNHDKARSTMDEALRILQEKHWSIWMFPEGTRSTGRGLLPFKRGAFKLAIESGRPILPIAISHYHRVLNLKKLRSGQINVEVLDPISVEGYTLANVDELMHRTQELMRQTIERIST